jgi:shikimate kinase
MARGWGIMERIIALAGPKHAGKTSAGRALAAITRGLFFDLDDEVQRGTGKTARALYKEGRKAFQDAEASALAAVFAGLDDGAAASGRAVIALGGGIIDNEAALALLRERPECAVVYLAVSARTAWKRIEDGAAGGELPAFLQTTNPKETHRALHERRAAAYRTIAALTVDAEEKSAAETAAAIVTAIAAAQEAREKVGGRG